MDTTLIGRMAVVAVLAVGGALATMGPSTVAAQDDTGPLLYDADELIRVDAPSYEPGALVQLDSPPLPVSGPGRSDAGPLPPRLSPRSGLSFRP